MATEDGTSSATDKQACDELHLWTGNRAGGVVSSGGVKCGHQRKGAGVPKGTMAFMESAELRRCRRLKGEVTRKEDMP